VTCKWNCQHSAHPRGHEITAQVPRLCFPANISRNNLCWGCLGLGTKLYQLF